MNFQFARLAVLFVLALLVAEPAHAGSLKSDADYLKKSAGKLSVVSPKRAARGYIAAQAYAISRNTAFKRAVRKYAKGKSPKKVLQEARRGGQRWLSDISGNTLRWQALSALARVGIAEQYEARGKKREAQLSAKQRKGRKLVDAKKKIQQERKRAAGGGAGSSSASGILAVFLVLNTTDPNNSPEVAQEITSAVSTLESCLKNALDKRTSCLANSNNLYENAVCENAFGADSIACLAK